MLRGGRALEEVGFAGVAVGRDGGISHDTQNWFSQLGDCISHISLEEYEQYNTYNRKKKFIRLAHMIRAPRVP